MKYNPKKQDKNFTNRFKIDEISPKTIKVFRISDEKYEDRRKIVTKKFK